MSRSASAQTFELFKPADLGADLRRRWLELHALGPAHDSPYLSPQWSEAVARAMGPGGQGVRVLVVRQQGEPVGFMPLKVGRLTAGSVGGAMCDYEGLVSAPGLTVDPAALVQALGVQRLDFRFMLADQPSFAAGLRGYETSRIVDVGGGFDAYAQGRREAGVGVLKDLAKKRRKVSREIATPRFTAFSTSEDDFEQLVAWKRGQMCATRQTDIFARPWVSRLVRDLFARQDEAFGGVLFTLHFGDELAAAQINIRGRHTIHAWLIAYAHGFQRYSPGLLLFEDILRWMDGGPYTHLDLGAGDYRFKRELANRELTVGHGFVGLPSLTTLVRRTAYDVRDIVEALPLGRVSHWPGKAMRRIDLIRGLS